MDEELLPNDFTADQGAYHSLIYEKYVDGLYAYGLALGACEDDCFDAIHDVFYKLFSNGKKLVSIDNIKAYLFRSFRNRLVDILSRNRRVDSIGSSPVSFNPEVEIADTFVTAEEEELLKRKVQALLGSLSDHQREVIYLRYMQRLEYDEMARILNITPESARKQVHRAIVTMRRQAAPNIVIALLVWLSCNHDKFI